MRSGDAQLTLLKKWSDAHMILLKKWNDAQMTLLKKWSDMKKWSDAQMILQRKLSDEQIAMLQRRQWINAQMTQYRRKGNAYMTLCKMKWCVSKITLVFGKDD